MWWAFLFPLVFNVLLFYLGIQAVNDASVWVLDQIKGWISFDGFEEETQGFLNSSLEIILWIVFKLMFFLLYAYIGGYVVIIVLSPFLSFVSERAEKANGGTLPPFKLGTFFYNIFRGIVIALRSFLYQTLLSLLILLLSFIPLVNLAVPFLLFLVSAFFYGFAFMDYFLERRISSISESIDFIKKRRLITMALGLPFSIVLAVPYVGSFLAGFVTIVAAVAATLYLMDKESKIPQKA